jgi:hypothetical protein
MLSSPLSTDVSKQNTLDSGRLLTEQLGAINHESCTDNNLFQYFSRYWNGSVESREKILNDIRTIADVVPAVRGGEGDVINAMVTARPKIARALREIKKENAIISLCSDMQGTEERIEETENFIKNYAYNPLDFNSSLKDQLHILNDKNCTPHCVFQYFNGYLHAPFERRMEVLDDLKAMASAEEGPDIDAVKKARPKIARGLQYLKEESEIASLCLDTNTESMKERIEATEGFIAKYFNSHIRKGDAASAMKEEAYKYAAEMTREEYVLFFNEYGKKIEGISESDDQKFLEKKGKQYGGLIKQYIFLNRFRNNGDYAGARENAATAFIYADMHDAFSFVDPKTLENKDILSVDQRKELYREARGIFGDAEISTTLVESEKVKKIEYYLAMCLSVDLFGSRKPVDYYYVKDDVVPGRGSEEEEVKKSHMEAALLFLEEEECVSKEDLGGMLDCMEKEKCAPEAVRFIMGAFCRHINENTRKNAASVWKEREKDFPASDISENSGSLLKRKKREKEGDKYRDASESETEQGVFLSEKKVTNSKRQRTGDEEEYGQFIERIAALVILAKDMPQKTAAAQGVLGNVADVLAKELKYINKINNSGNDNLIKEEERRLKASPEENDSLTSDILSVAHAGALESATVYPGDLLFSINGSLTKEERGRFYERLRNDLAEVSEDPAVTVPFAVSGVPLTASELSRVSALAEQRRRNEDVGRGH